MNSMKKVLTGMRPTGRLHLGHYIGALRQWIPLQETHECYFLIADVQALTTHADDPKLIQDAVTQVTLDFLSVGLDPRRPNVHFVLQSGIAELYELTVLLSMVTPYTWVATNPTVRSELEHIGSGATVGFMSYPVSQSADILFVGENPSDTILVPVGEDQVAHLRLNNKIAAAFNRTYGPTFPMCEALVGDVGRLPGIAGDAKMSKSLDNGIDLSATPETVRKQVMRMFTDPKRVHANTPGTVEGNPVFIYHNAFNDRAEEVAELEARYRAGTVRDVEVKELLIEALERFLGPIRQRRAEAEASPELVAYFLAAGTVRAHELAQATVVRARQAMGLTYPNLFKT